MIECNVNLVRIGEAFKCKILIKIMVPSFDSCYFKDNYDGESYWEDGYCKHMLG